LLYKELQWGPRSFDVSPDGQWLAFYPSPESLAIMPSEGGEPREIVHGSNGEMPSNREFVKWTPDGKNLLFGKRNNELWKVNVETGQQQQIAMIGQDLINAIMHPDDQRIAITAQQSGSQLWIMENFLPEQ
jgi:Tol biopolymer transport system component